VLRPGRHAVRAAAVYYGDDKAVELSTARLAMQGQASMTGGRAMMMHKQTKGFTLIELMIVVGVIGLIATMALPMLMRSRMSTNESTAVASLRTVLNAETQFQAAVFVDADSDNVGDFAALSGATSLANPAAGTEPFIDEVLADGSKNGYIYVIVVDNAGAGDEAFTCTARPVTYGRTGVRSFFIDESGVVRFEIANVAPTVNSAPIA